MGYVHVEINKIQVEKKAGAPCGDAFDYHRDEKGTFIFLADGMGSGIKANIAATMSISRLKTLINQGFSMRRAFRMVTKSLIHAAKNDLPYAVISVARVLNEGVTTILSYEMPPPIFVSRKYSTILSQRKFPIDDACIYEANCYLNPHEAVLLVSDGITQAGLGRGLNFGWKIEGVKEFINSQLSCGYTISDLPKLIYNQAFDFCGRHNDDDVSVVMGYCRLGVTVNIMSGPPKERESNKEAVKKFMDSPGIKIVCGATTAKIVAEAIGSQLKAVDGYENPITPPPAEIKGIDLVTEGIITLNQLNNILDEDRDYMLEDNPVTDLYDYVSLADKVNFFLGTAENPANKELSFKQMGLKPRISIINRLAEKLRDTGKLVVVHEM